jgi:hypothetical protein
MDVQPGTAIMLYGHLRAPASARHPLLVTLEIALAGEFFGAWRASGLTAQRGLTHLLMIDLCADGGATVRLFHASVVGANATGGALLRELNHEVLRVRDVLPPEAAEPAASGILLTNATAS